jgi:hypothetical protein
MSPPPHGIQAGIAFANPCLSVRAYALKELAFNRRMKPLRLTGNEAHFKAASKPLRGNPLQRDDPGDNTHYKPVVHPQRRMASRRRFM